VVKNKGVLDTRSYDERLSDCIRRVISHEARSFLEIVRSGEGAYPTLIRHRLRHLAPQINENTVSTYGPLCGDSPYRSVLETVEANPLLCSWYFTEVTCRRISTLRDWKRLRLGFLGTPRLFEWFSQNDIGRERVLFDLDSLVMDRLSSQVKRPEDLLINFDMAQEIPEQFAGRFDCVFLDPPWYESDYFLWLSRASTLSPSGIVVMPMFPALTRPEAVVERTSILERLQNSTDDLNFLLGVVEYEIPGFEQNQLKASGIEFYAPWKIADLVVGRLSSLIPYQSKVRPTLAGWKEINFPSLRLFLNISDVNLHARSLLSYVTEGSVFLASPSRREPSRKRANLLTSRGHGLFTASPHDLLRVLLSLESSTHKSETVNAAIQKLDCDPQTKFLLSEIFRKDG
jgi:dGTPase